MEPLMEDRKRMLEKYSIADLRLLGRSLSIKSPTSLSKKDLINAILSMMYGSCEEDLETRGRSTKESSQKETEKPKTEYLYTYQKLNTENYSTIKLSTSKSDYEIVDDDGFVFESENEENLDLEVSDVGGLNLKRMLGYIDIVNNEIILRIINSSRFISISEDHQKLLNFKQYDSVEFTSFYSPFQNKTFLLDVIKINGIERLIHGEQCFKELSIVPPQEKIAVENNYLTNVLEKITAIPKGARVLVVGKPCGQRFRILSDLNKAFKDKDVLTFPIIMSEVNEAKIFIQKNLPQSTFISQSETPEVACEKILVDFYRAQRVVESGGHAVILLDNLDAVFDCLESLITDENKNYITTMVNKFFNMGGNYSNGGKLTIFACVDKTNLKLVERAKGTATIVLPLSDQLLNEKVYPAIEIGEIKTRLDSFYIDEESKNVCDDIKKVVISKDKSKYASVIKTLRSVKGSSKEQLLERLYNL